MKAIKIASILVLAYMAVVIIFESLLGYFQPEDAGTLVITTFDDDGTGHDRVLTALESDGQLYVAVNHWPRAWYRRAIALSDVRVARDGESGDYEAVPVVGEEHDRMMAEHPIPVGVRLLMGYAPRSFLRLEPKPGG